MFLEIFWLAKLEKKIVDFELNYSNIDFKKVYNFCLRKLVEIAAYSDHNIEPRYVGLAWVFKPTTDTSPY
jgi:hypothetical protein